MRSTLSPDNKGSVYFDKIGGKTPLKSSIFLKGPAGVCPVFLMKVYSYETNPLSKKSLIKMLTIKSNSW